MTTEELTHALLADGFTAETIDTNNSWGFGGSLSTRLTRGKIVVTLGAAYYRHLPSARFVTVAINGRRVLDDTQRSEALGAVYGITILES